MQTQQLSSLILAAALVLPTAALASGSYTSRPPRPPTARTDGGERMDAARYELGKRVYNGKATLGGPDTSPGQEARLRALQARLPAKEQNKANLPSLNGRLTAEQLDALEYYVAHRFPQK